MKYAVISTYKIGDKQSYNMPSINVFDGIEDAKKYLRATYQEMVNSDRESGWFEFIASISDDKKHAKIIQIFGGSKQ